MGHNYSAVSIYCKLIQKLYHISFISTNIGNFLKKKKKTNIGKFLKHYQIKKEKFLKVLYRLIVLLSYFEWKKVTHLYHTKPLLKVNVKMLGIKVNCQTKVNKLD